MNDNKIVLSKLGHTWIFDLDGTILKHNGYKIDGQDSFLPGAKEFLMNLPDKDMIIFLTSRDKCYRNETEEFLRKSRIRYDYIIFGAPYGERILVNDNKPGGLRGCLGICTTRDKWSHFSVEEDESL